MYATRIVRWSGMAALLGLGTVLGLDQASGFQPRPPDSSGEIEILTRGPVHEAFAATVSFDPQPGLLIQTAPPDAIEELPPDQRPEGVNVAWIPGYWAWDDEGGVFRHENNAQRGGR